MKTSISIPDPLFEAVERLARSLGVSRSEVFQRAVELLVRDLDDRSVTAALDDVYSGSERGELWWASLGQPSGSEPGFRRPVVVVQADAFNRSRISTVVVAMVTSNLALAAAPGNVRLTKRQTGLARESVVNVSQVVTLDKRVLTERVGVVPSNKMKEVDKGLQLVLGLVHSG